MVLFNGVSRAHLISVTMQRIVALTNMVSHSSHSVSGIAIGLYLRLRLNGFRNGRCNQVRFIKCW